MKNSIYIIPNDSIKENEFFQEVEKDHIEGIKEFSKIYQMDYLFKNEDSQEAPCLLASLGHLVIKFENNSNIVICYIPKIVTDRQSMWMYQNKDKLESRSIIGAFLINDDNNYKELSETKGLQNILNIINRRNIFYENKSDTHIGRKIK